MERLFLLGLSAPARLLERTNCEGAVRCPRTWLCQGLKRAPMNVVLLPRPFAPPAEIVNAAASAQNPFIPPSLSFLLQGDSDERGGNEWCLYARLAGTGTHGTVATALASDGTGLDGEKTRMGCQGGSKREDPRRWYAFGMERECG